MIKPSPLDLAYRRPVGPIPWPEFVAEIAPLYRQPKVTRGRACYFKMACRILSGLGVESTYDLNNAMVDLLVAGRPEGQSAYTLHGVLAMVRRICSLAVSHRCLDVSPFTIRPIAELVRLGRPKGKRHLTRDEIGRLLELLRGDIATRKGWALWKSRRLHVVACIGLYCGLRRDELLRLEVADIDLEARLIRLRPHGPTGRFKTDGSEQPVPIAEALVQIIRDWLCHRLDAPRGFVLPAEVPYLIPTCDRKAPWTSGSHGGSRALAQLQAAAKRAGIDHITLHTLRRSSATHMEAMGVPRSMISRILRHSGEMVTERHYLRADEQAMIDAVKGFEF